jgi:exonuclease SbcD
MKLFHLADLHLGKALHGRELYEDQRYALAQVVAAARAERPDALILAGDVFDRAVPPVEAIVLFNEFITALKVVDEGLAVVAIPGNHDSAQRLGYLSGVLAARGVHLRADASLCDRPIELRRGLEALRIWAIPFLSPGALEDSSALATGEENLGGVASPGAGSPSGSRVEGASAAASPPAPLRSQEALFKEALRRIERARWAASSGAGAAEGGGPERPFELLVAHAYAAGCSGSDSERPFLGATDLVDASLFNGFDYAALGHLHRPQAAGERGRYPGSLLQYSFADQAGERGFLVVELSRAAVSDDAAADAQARAELRFVPVIPLRRLSRIRGRLRELLAEPRYAAYEGDYVEATLVDGEGELNPMEALRSRFPYALALRLGAEEAGADAAARPDGADVRPPAGQSAARRDPLDDFKAFYAAMRDGEPGEEEARLFAELLSEARDEAE